MMEDRLDNKENIIFKRIDEILHFDWNPLGIDDLPRNEYSSYVPEIYRLKKSGASSKIIAQTLKKIEIKTLGVTTNDMNNCMLVAEKIQSL